MKSEIIDTPEDANAALVQWRKQYHVVSPVTEFVTPFHPAIYLAASVVQLSPEVDTRGRGHDTYCDDAIMRQDERAVAKGGLMKLCQAAGLVWTERCGRRDGRSHTYVWEYFAGGHVRTFDDDLMLMTGECEIDLRDGSSQIGGWTPTAWADAMQQHGRRRGTPTINGWTEARVLDARSMGLRHAETKAKLNAVRAGLGIRSTYTVDELERAFLVVRAALKPDPSVVRAEATSAARALYAPQVSDGGPEREGE